MVRIVLTVFAFLDPVTPTSSGRGDKRPHGEIVDEEGSVPKKKKYAKEAWPGRKHGPAQGLF